MTRQGFPIWIVQGAGERPVERRAGPRKAPLVTAAGLRVESLGFEVMRLHRAAWLDLAARALESNVFLDPDFALAAAQHAAPALRPRFLAVRGVVEGRMRLVGLFALAPGGALFGGLARGWMHQYATQGAPLLDRATPAEALEAVLAFVAAQTPRAGALLLPSLARDGAVAALLAAREAGEAGCVTLETRARAVLACGPGAAGADETKEHRRLHRRLAELGRLEFSLLDDPAAVREGVERFLALETAGWKGAAGTALLQDVGAAAFARCALRLMARRGAARVAALTLDGAPVALGLVLVDGETAAFWKIAYDPAFARYSPGVLLTLRLSEALAADPAIGFVDSCAIENHPMIDRVWRERQAIVDVVAPLPRRARAFAAAVSRERARRRLRSVVKRAYYAVTARKAS